ncbi:hypothetical protein MNBD_GAMMA23-1118 [hydrothermal vent metagenome]|uniref:Helix-turn-helix domain-containing protein n=1 Tax=hydrothermal vent metagenome TaxID=652676 RepID=A0A3B0ZXR5_9ZZZZ
MNNDRRNLNPQRCRKYLRLADKTAYRLTVEDKLPGFKVGGSWRFRKDEVEKLTKGEMSGIKTK